MYSLMGICVGFIGGIFVFEARTFLGKVFAFIITMGVTVLFTILMHNAGIK